MNQRILQFLAAENISQSQFADTIDVAKATISHIISGRNKPGFDFIESVSRHYPNLSIEWLITGKGKMYKTSAESEQELSKKQVQQNRIQSSDEGSLFDLENINNTIDEDSKLFNNEPSKYIKSAADTYKGISRQNEAISSEIAAADNAIKRSTERKIKQAHPENISAINIKAERRISKIIVFFDDNTFQELS